MLKGFEEAVKRCEELLSEYDIKEFLNMHVGNKDQIDTISYNAMYTYSHIDSNDTLFEIQYYYLKTYKADIIKIMFGGVITVHVGDNTYNVESYMRMNLSNICAVYNSNDNKDGLVRGLVNHRPNHDVPFKTSYIL